MAHEANVLLAALAMANIGPGRQRLRGGLDLSQDLRVLEAIGRYVEHDLVVPDQVGVRVACALADCGITITYGDTVTITRESTEEAT